MYVQKTIISMSKWLSLRFASTKAIVACKPPCSPGEIQACSKPPGGLLGDSRKPARSLLWTLPQQPALTINSLMHELQFWYPQKKTLQTFKWRTDAWSQLWRDLNTGILIEKHEQMKYMIKPVGLHVPRWLPQTLELLTKQLKNWTTW